MQYASNLAVCSSISNPSFEHFFLIGPFASEQKVASGVFRTWALAEHHVGDLQAQMNKLDHVELPILLFFERNRASHFN